MISPLEETRLSLNNYDYFRRSNRLIIINNMIKPENKAVNISEIITLNPFIESFYINNTPMSFSGVSCLARLISSSSTLSELALTCIELNLFDIQLICEALKLNRFVTIFNLNFVRIDSLKSQFISQLIISNSFITELILSDTNLQSDGMQNILKSLSQNSTITNLNLSGNAINRDEAIYLKEFLASNSTLTKLTINYCRIDDSLVSIISRGLESNSSLSSLNIDNNHKITSHGAEFLLDMLCVNSTLTKLNMDFSEFENFKPLILERIETNLHNKTIRSANLQTMCCNILSWPDHQFLRRYYPSYYKLYVRLFSN